MALPIKDQEQFESHGKEIIRKIRKKVKKMIEENQPLVESDEVWSGYMQGSIYANLAHGGIDFEGLVTQNGQSIRMELEGFCVSRSVGYASLHGVLSLGIPPTKTVGKCTIQGTLVPKDRGGMVLTFLQDQVIIGVLIGQGIGASIGYVHGSGTWSIPEG